jgi:GDSL-like Lipase/Acylhydrolase family
MQQNQIRQPLILVFAVTVLLSILSFINTTKLFSSKLKPIDLFADLKTTKKDTASQKKQTIITTKKAKATKAEINELAIQDYSATEENSFANFISLLQNAKNKKVRIAYFGDSFIESDLVTNELRQLLQKQYGGNGVGFVPMECINSEMRKSVVQTTSNNWMVNENASKLLKAFTANDSYSKFNLQQPYKNCTIAKLFYQATQNSPIQIEADSSHYEQVLPATNNNLVAQKINQATFSSLRITANSTTTNFYGVSFEDSTGVYVDNFSLRGSNGTHLLKLDTTTLQQFNAVQQYNLVVLHFGVNVLNNNDKLDWYKIGLQKTINFLQQQMPNAAILIISTSDKATKTNGVYETDKGVSTLVDIQNEIAQKNGTAFWNLYQNMGGYNSMLNWVNADTALAYKDYTHINFKGAAKVANLLYQNITNFK